VTGFAESLSYELRGTGISVTVVEPGLVRSGFQAVSGTPLARFGQLPSQTSTEAADRVLAAMSRERRLHVADRWAGLAIRLRRHLPRLLRLLYRVGYERARRRA
jgi:short-subunit dehydrogenase